ncbi:DUF448 domain-containing protein [uncultured Campylobacter sp.]|uniref:DUF448 domain-containing protein n=1 Tax=uncultured Campylobacter sp. TaxID=218934 RepID=UPI00263051F1|nr:DUF448 domain-containing protein [uncultured Campylobacter sp.]
MSYKNSKIPSRMCVICKKREPQKELNRYQATNGAITKEIKDGRSFYICNLCLNNFDEKKFRKILSKFIFKETTTKELKEMLIDG